MLTLEQRRNLSIPATPNLPMVDFDREANVLIIKGRSFPENATIFYYRLFEWVDYYLLTKPVHTTLNLSFQYLHTGSGVQVYNLIKRLLESEQTGNTVIINWFYEEDDEDLRQVGIDFSSVLRKPFNYNICEF